MKLFKKETLGFQFILFFLGTYSFFYFLDSKKFIWLCGSIILMLLSIFFNFNGSENHILSEFH